MVHTNYTHCQIDTNPHYYLIIIALFLSQILLPRMQTVQMSISAFFLPAGAAEAVLVYI